MKAYQLKAAIKKSKPLSWRRCMVPAGITYSQLSILLASLMEENADKDFEFEFYQRKVRFREDDGTRPFHSDFYYDLAESSENYIDELFDQEEWFSFYYGAELALRVTIEKRLKSCEEKSPVIMAGRGEIRAVGRDHCDLRESLLKKDDQWKKLFAVSFGEPEFKKRDEIRKELADGRYGLHCCAAAVSNTQKTSYSGHHYIKAFADKLKDMYEKGDFGDKREQSYEEALMDLLLAPGGASDISPAGNSQAQEQPPAEGVALKDLLLYDEREELKAFGRKLRLRGISSLNKERLAEKIANEMLSGGVMRENFITLRDEEISAWEECIRHREGFQPSAEISDWLERIYHRKYLMIYDDDFVDIPEDVIQKYHQINTPDFQKLRSQVAWMMDCLWLQDRIYGSSPLSVMIRMYRKRSGFSINREEWLSVFGYIPESEKSWVIERDRVIAKVLWGKEECRRLEQMQDGRDFSIPDEEEIMDCSRNGYPSGNLNYQKLKGFFQENMKLEEQHTDRLLRLIWNLSALGYSVSEIMDCIEHDGGRFSNAKDGGALRQLLQAAYEHTRMAKYQGYTQREYCDMEQRKNGFSGGLLPIRPVRTERVKDPNKRIYPNDPCPCGSGKKYKKCCGK